MGLAGDIPEPKLSNTGQVTSNIKTKVTDVSPQDYIESLPWPRRVTHGKQLLEIFNRVTDKQPVMWGQA